MNMRRTASLGVGVGILLSNRIDLANFCLHNMILVFHIKDRIIIGSPKK